MNNTYTKKFTPKYDNDLVPLWYLKQEINNQLEEIKQNVEEEKITSGSNSDGSWIKYPDGTMICHNKVTTSVSFNTLADGMYGGSMDLGYFPQTFVEIPNVQVTNSCASSAIIQNFILMATTTYPGSIYLIRPDSITTDITIDVLAIGKWK